MKNMKSKLLASVAMLLVSAIMLTSASFAWFTISTAPEISNISTSVTSNGNLEIALDNSYATADAIPASGSNDSGSNVTWGNLVDLDDYFGAETTEIVLKPVKVTNAGVVSVPVWGDDGRVSSLSEVTAAQASEDENLAGIYTYSANSSIYAVRVDFWLRSNVAGNISLSTADDRGNGAQGSGSTLTSTNTNLKFTDGEDELIKVAFLSEDGFVVAERATDGALTADVCALAANTAKKVSMYLYMDGEVIDNEHFLNEETAQEIALNIQFKHSEDLVAMDPGTATE